MLALPEKDRAEFRERFKNAKLNTASFMRHYAWCEIGECRGMCCHGGVWLEPQEVGFHQANEAHYRQFLPGVGVDDIPANLPLLESGEPDRAERLNIGTSTKPFDYKNQKNYPPSFEHTSCVFRRADGACGLQLLAGAENRISWYYKPVYCWLYPIDIEELEDGSSTIGILTPEEDPDFSAFAMCAQQRTEKTGKPGYEIFAREIAALSGLLGRDLMAEIKAEIPKNEQLLSAG